MPRNDLRRQVPQPNAAQVNWAIQQATRNLLKLYKHNTAPLAA